MTDYKRPTGNPDFQAEIFAIPSAEGGRKSPMFSGYRPNHDFGIEGELNDAQHEYIEGQLAPGETGIALLWLLAPERQARRLFEGFQFTVQEGSRIVGRGKITKVLNTKLKRDI